MSDNLIQYSATVSVARNHGNTIKTPPQLAPITPRKTEIIDPIWKRIWHEANEIVRTESALADYLNDTVLRLSDVPPNCTVTGIPAKVVGKPSSAEPARQMDQRGAVDFSI